MLVHANGTILARGKTFDVAFDLNPAGRFGMTFADSFENPIGFVFSVLVERGNKGFAVDIGVHHVEIPPHRCMIQCKMWITTNIITYLHKIFNAEEFLKWQFFTNI